MNARRPGIAEYGQTARLFEALRFAAEKHRDGRRKGDIAAPYINHPITVAEQLAAAGLEQDTDLLIAALLHDVLEDTQTSAEELRQRFGERVAGIVLELTDDKGLDWRERKRLVVESIGAKSRAAQLIKLSDLTANVTDLIHHPPNWSIERKRGYLAWAERVVGAMRGVQPNLERRFADLLREAYRQVGVG
jgi:guanosine-3',5'-bis(diphosphate) 3'-pyrophosphohydrolase